VAPLEGHGSNTSPRGQRLVPSGEPTSRFSPTQSLESRPDSIQISRGGPERAADLVSSSRTSPTRTGRELRIHTKKLWTQLKDTAAAERETADKWWQLQIQLIQTSSPRSSMKLKEDADSTATLLLDAERLRTGSENALRQALDRIEAEATDTEGDAEMSLQLESVLLREFELRQQVEDLVVQKNQVSSSLEISKQEERKARDVAEDALQRLATVQKERAAEGVALRERLLAVEEERDHLARKLTQSDLRANTLERVGYLTAAVSQSEEVEGRTLVDADVLQERCRRSDEDVRRLEDQLFQTERARLDAERRAASACADLEEVVARERSTRAENIAAKTRVGALEQLLSTQAEERIERSGSREAGFRASSQELVQVSETRLSTDTLSRSRSASPRMEDEVGMWTAQTFEPEQSPGKAELHFPRPRTVKEIESTVEDKQTLAWQERAERAEAALSELEGKTRYEVLEYVKKLEVDLRSVRRERDTLALRVSSRLDRLEAAQRGSSPPFSPGKAIPKRRAAPTSSPRDDNPQRRAAGSSSPPWRTGMRPAVPNWLAQRASPPKRRVLRPQPATEAPGVLGFEVSQAGAVQPSPRRRAREGAITEKVYSPQRRARQPAEPGVRVETGILGIEVVEVKGGVQVVVAKRPAAPLVQEGDFILKLHGSPTPTLRAYRNAVQSVPHNSNVEFVLRRGRASSMGELKSIQIRTRPRRNSTSRSHPRPTAGGGTFPTEVSGRPPPPAASVPTARLSPVQTTRTVRSEGVSHVRVEKQQQIVAHSGSLSPSSTGSDRRERKRELVVEEYRAVTRAGERTAPQSPTQNERSRSVSPRDHSPPRTVLEELLGGMPGGSA